jgi:hypothetical protein
MHSAACKIYSMVWCCCTIEMNDTLRLLQVLIEPTTVLEPAISGASRHGPIFTSMNF